MTIPDGLSCWQLLLIANTVTAWVAWRCALPQQDRSAAGYRLSPWTWFAAPVWMSVILLVWLRCGWGWTALVIALSILLGVLVFTFCRYRPDP